MEPNNLITKIIIGFVVMIVCLFTTTFFHALDENNDFGTFMHSLCVTLYTSSGIAWLGSVLYILGNILSLAL